MKPEKPASCAKETILLAVLYLRRSIVATLSCLSCLFTTTITSPSPHLHYTGRRGAVYISENVLPVLLSGAGLDISSGKDYILLEVLFNEENIL